MPSLVHIFAGGKRKLADSATYSSAVSSAPTTTGSSSNISPLVVGPGPNEVGRPHRGLEFAVLRADDPHRGLNSNIIGYIPHQYHHQHHHIPYQYHQHHRAISTNNPPYCTNYYARPPPRETTPPMIDTHNRYPQEERRKLKPSVKEDSPSDKYSDDIDCSNDTYNFIYNNYLEHDRSSLLNKEDHSPTIQGIDADKRSNNVSSPSTHVRKKVRAEKDGSIQSKFTSFDERCNQLLQFKEEFGHYIVKRDYIGNPSLGIWCKNMRVAYNKRINGMESMHKLTPYRIERMENLGFEWTTSTSSSRRCSI